MRHRLASLRLTGLAIAGVVAGHLAAYAVAFGDPRIRHEVLAETGHAHWETVVVGAGLLGLAGLGSSVLGHVRHRARSVRLLPLAGLQVALFVLLEVAERAVTGSSVAHFLGDHLFTIGITLQLAVALATALAVRLLARTARALVAAFRRPRTSGAAGPPRPPVPALGAPAAALGGPLGARAPPRL